MAVFPIRMTKRRRAVLIGAAIVIAYAVGLALWAGNPVGGGTPDRLPAAAGAPASVTPPVGFPSAAPSSAPSTSAASGSTAGGLLGKLKSFPNSMDAQAGVLPVRSVRIVIESDNVIAAMAYKVAHGKPASYSAQWLKAPVTITTSGRSGGLVTEVLAEAGPTATYVTCKVYVDGVLRSRNTAHGRYQFTACIG